MLTSSKGFLCGGPFRDASEATHWSPFLSHAARWIYKNLKKPWTEEEEKMVVFMLGMHCHAQSDLAFHGLGVAKNSLIDMASEIDFNGNWSEAHDIADRAGEAISSYQFNSNFLINRWYIPSKHLERVCYMFVISCFLDLSKCKLYTCFRSGN